MESSLSGLKVDLGDLFQWSFTDPWAVVLVLASPSLSPQNAVGNLNKNQNRHGSSSCISQNRLDSFETRNRFQIARNSRKHHIPPWTWNLLLCPRTGANHLLLPCLHKKDSRDTFLTLSLCYSWSSPAECRKGQVHFSKSVCKGGLGRINMFLRY